MALAIGYDLNILLLRAKVMGQETITVITSQLHGVTKFFPPLATFEINKIPILGIKASLSNFIERSLNFSTSQMIQIILLNRNHLQ